MENITKIYSNGFIANKGINLELKRGEIHGLVGENGAGKSTTMKTLLNLVKPISGELTYGDGIKPYEVGYLPQQTVVQRDFPASVYEIVISGNLAKIGMRPFYSKKERDNTKLNMKRMNVWEFRNKSYKNLSGGQQQRVLLARALCATSKLLLLDEPVTGLDPKVTIEFYQLIKALNEEGITIIMITHDIHAAVEYAGKILHLGQNNVFFGTKEEYKLSDAYKEFEV